MAHDKIRAAARERMASTSEPYAAARREVVTGHLDDSGQTPAGGYALRMSGEIHDWLAELGDSDPAAAMTVVQALVALLHQGDRLGEPLVVCPADSWPAALAAGLDRSYQERLERLTAVRRQAAAASRPWPEGAEAKRLVERCHRLNADANAFRATKEIFKASYTAAKASLLIHQAAANAGEAGSAEARLLRHVITQMEQELGHEAWPDGLMELRPAGPAGTRILFATEPPGTALLIAVLDGPQAVQDQYLEAILLSADRLRQVRAGQAPEAAAFGYDSTRQFLDAFYPGDAGD